MNCLSGQALTAYRSIALGDESTAYEDMRDKLLEAMELGIEQTRRRFWNPGR